MAATVAGTRAPLSYCASLRAARMLAAISSTRLRPFVHLGSLALSPLFAIGYLNAMHALACVGVHPGNVHSVSRAFWHLLHTDDTRLRP